MKLVRTAEYNGHTVEIHDLESNRKVARFVLKIDGEWDWTERRGLIEAIAAAKAATAPTAPEAPHPQPQPARVVTGRTGWSKYSRGPRHRDQLGGYMEGAFGLTSPATARGDCHYCGLALNRNGECEECR